MQAMSTAASGTRHALKAVAEAVLITAIVAALLVALAPVSPQAKFLAGTGEAVAARGGHASGVTISVPDGRFGGTTTASTNQGSGLWVHVTCYVNGTIGLSTWKTTDSAGQATFNLGPTPSWQSGSASCTADAGSYNRRAKFVIAASTGFSVLGL